MSLVSKMIRYPDELQAMGFTRNGNYNNMGSQEPSQDSINNTIKDISDFFNNYLNLIKVPKENDIDLNNIPTHDFYGMAKLTMLAQWSTYSFGFETFALSDDLQDTKPIFIQFEYCMRVISTGVNNAQVPNRFAFDIIMDIFYNNRSIYRIGLGNICARPQWTTPSSYGLNQEVTESCGFVNNNRLYINILPNRYVWFLQGNYDSSFGNYKSSYFSFYLERTGNYIKYYPLSRNKNASATSQDSASINESIIFIDYSGNQYNTTDCVHIPFINKRLNSGRNSAFKTLDIDTSNNTMKESIDVLTTYTDQVAGTGNIVEVEIDNIKYEYVSYKPEPNKNTYYFRNTSTSLLLRT